MVADQIRKVIIANKQLKAAGAETVNVVKQIGKSLLSFNAIMMLVVTLLTFFGEDILKWAKNLITGNKVIISMETPFGYLQQVVDRECLREGVEEGEIEIDGKHFIVEFCNEDEVDKKVGKPISELNSIDIMKIVFGDTMSEADKEDY